MLLIDHQMFWSSYISKIKLVHTDDVLNGLEQSWLWSYSSLLRSRRKAGTLSGAKRGLIRLPAQRYSLPIKCCSFRRPKRGNSDMEAPTEISRSAPEFEYDLSAVLVKAGTLYEKRLGSEWLLFAPDWPGWPVVVNDSIHGLMDQFQTPSTVGDVFARFAERDLVHLGAADLGLLVNAVGFLEDGGFLRTGVTNFPYLLPTCEPSPPNSLEVWLHVTNACNLDCTYCFVKKKDAEVMHDSVCDATAEKLARTAISNRLEKVTVKFAGGEPTLAMPVVERFWARFEAAVAGTSIRTHAALLTNGTQIDDRVIAFLNRPNSSISISLDGCGDAHDLNRRTKGGTPTWHRIVKNMDRLQNNDISPFIMTTITNGTRQGLPELIRWVFSRGLQMRISVVRELGCGPDDDCQAFAETMGHSFNDAFALLEAEQILFDPRLDLQICELRFDQPTLWVACGIGSNHLVVRPDGTLVRCPMTVDTLGHPAGEDLLAACRGTFPFKPSDSREGTDGAGCLSCRWFPVCAGGCPVNNEKTRGHPFARSPLCTFYQMVIPRYLDLFGRKLQERFAIGQRAQTH